MKFTDVIVQKELPRIKEIIPNGQLRNRIINLFDSTTVRIVTIYERGGSKKPLREPFPDEIQYIKSTGGRYGKSRELRYGNNVKHKNL